MKKEELKKIWRGIFSIKHKRKILFIQENEIKISELPRWKPYIKI